MMTAAGAALPLPFEQVAWAPWIGLLLLMVILVAFLSGCLLFFILGDGARARLPQHVPRKQKVSDVRREQQQELVAQGHSEQLSDSGPQELDEHGRWRSRIANSVPMLDVPSEPNSAIAREKIRIVGCTDAVDNSMSGGTRPTKVSLFQPPAEPVPHSTGRLTILNQASPLMAPPSEPASQVPRMSVSRASDSGNTPKLPVLETANDGSTPATGSRWGAHAVRLLSTSSSSSKSSFPKNKAVEATQVASAVGLSTIGESIQDKLDVDGDKGPTMTSESRTIKIVEIADAAEIENKAPLAVDVDYKGPTMTSESRTIKIVEIADTAEIDYEASSQMVAEDMQMQGTTSSKSIRDRAGDAEQKALQFQRSLWQVKAVPVGSLLSASSSGGSRRPSERSAKLPSSSGGRAESSSGDRSTGTAMTKDVSRADEVVHQLPTVSHSRPSSPRSASAGRTTAPQRERRGTSVEVGDSGASALPLASRAQPRKTSVRRFRRPSPGGSIRGKYTAGDESAPLSPRSPKTVRKPRRFVVEHVDIESGRISRVNQINVNMGAPRPDGNETVETPTVSRQVVAVKVKSETNTRWKRTVKSAAPKKGKPQEIKKD